MARLDDITTLPTNLELSGRDSFVIADKSFRGGTFAKQIPAAMVSNYSHAWLINYDSASFDVSAHTANLVLKSFPATDSIITAAAAIVTVPFAGLGSGTPPKVNVGSNSNIDALVDSTHIDVLTAGLFNQNPADEASEGLLFTAGQTLIAFFDAGDTGGSEKQLGEATAGQIIILANIVNVNDYKDFIPPID